MFCCSQPSQSTTRVVFACPSLERSGKNGFALQKPIEPVGYTRDSRLGNLEIWSTLREIPSLQIKGKNRTSFSLYGTYFCQSRNRREQSEYKEVRAIARSARYGISHSAHTPFENSKPVARILIASPGPGARIGLSGPDSVTIRRVTVL